MSADEAYAEGKLIADADDAVKFAGKESFQQKRRELKRKFWLIVIGSVLIFTGYNSYVTLQSSIHVEDGIVVLSTFGEIMCVSTTAKRTPSFSSNSYRAKITTITYVIQFALSLFLAPLLLRLIGARKTFILGDSFYIIYVVMNTFSNEVLLIIGAIAASFAEATFWLAAAIVMVYFAKKYHKVSCKSESRCIMEFSGIFYGMYEFNQVIGSTIITIVLKLTNAQMSSSPLPAFQNTSSSMNFYNYSELQFSTSAYKLQEDLATKSLNAKESYQYCGANDCQNAEIVDESLDSYVPTNKITLYVLTGSFSLAMLLGLVVHIVLVPEMQLSDFNHNYDSENKREDQISHQKSLKKVVVLSYQTTKDLFVVLLNPYQFFMITPYTLYVGLNLGFVLSEATRAYASCILGVNSIGICIIIFALSATINSMLIGKIFGKRGIAPLIIFQIIFDLSLYIFCLFWQPTSGTTWVVYVLFGLLGIYNSTGGIISTNFMLDIYNKRNCLKVTVIPLHTVASLLEKTFNKITKKKKIAHYLTRVEIEKA